MKKYDGPDLKYCYPETEILINKFDIRDSSILESLETTLTANRIMELESQPIIGNFNFSHLKAIHHYIFQDIYPFAGQVREINIQKDNFQFSNYLFIEDNAKDLFHRLKEEKELSGLDRTEFAKKAAYYMAEINVLHPFREGNGRSQREFIRTLALRNGYRLNWSRVDKNTILEASIRSIVDERALANVIEQCIENVKPDLMLKKSYLEARKKEKGLER